MSIPYFLHRWPITVAPAAILGGLVTLRFAAEAMSLASTTAAAWSSSVGLLLSAFYLGGIGPLMGVLSPRQLLAPALALGWVWRLWTFLATFVSALLGYKTHFFDPSQGREALRLLELFGRDVVVLGLLSGLFVWAIAVWVSRATRPRAEA
jgi:hypothetical protein